MTFSYQIFTCQIFYTAFKIQHIIASSISRFISPFQTDQLTCARYLNFRPANQLALVVKISDRRDQLARDIESFISVPNPFHFGLPDPDPSSKKSAKIMENFHENQ